MRYPIIHPEAVPASGLAGEARLALARAHRAARRNDLVRHPALGPCVAEFKTVVCGRPFAALRPVAWAGGLDTLVHHHPLQWSFAARKA